MEEDPAHLSHTNLEEEQEEKEAFSIQSGLSSPSNDNKSSDNPDYFKKEKKKEQNREAQRRYRERQKEKIKELEDKLAGREFTGNASNTANNNNNQSEGNINNNSSLLPLVVTALSQSVRDNNGQSQQEGIEKGEKRKREDQNAVENLGSFAKGFIRIDQLTPGSKVSNLVVKIVRELEDGNKVIVGDNTASSILEYQEVHKSLMKVGSFINIHLGSVVYHQGKMIIRVKELIKVTQRQEGFRVSNNLISYPSRAFGIILIKGVTLSNFQVHLKRGLNSDWLLPYALAEDEETELDTLIRMITMDVPSLKEDVQIVSSLPSVGHYVLFDSNLLLVHYKVARLRQTDQIDQIEMDREGGWFNYSEANKMLDGNQSKVFKIITEHIIEAIQYKVLDNDESTI
eukprot:TRINITY_DN9201_c0_g1_i1.p1 TRINITY_DN9201_c0_g1~~TRINITY_DN9201_c0_g1_i1.p1  ORF type:complete len:400 (+),score=110.18 TRINITY_DN9201_c0_g1_i1:32-1231(+)